MKIIFVFAHPDDETFGCGGTIAKLSKSGHTAKLINVTLGEDGQLGDPPLTTRENLANFRKKELECAAKIIGINGIFYFNFKDGELNKLNPKTFVDSILRILNQENPDIVVTFDKRGGSNHPDHIATSRAATRAYLEYQKKAEKHVRLYHTAFPRSMVKKFIGTDIEYKAFGRILGVPDSDITTIVDIADTYEAKVKAFYCHATQKKDWSRILKRADFVDVKKEYFQLISENKII